jgi:hypothetical protein
MDQLTMASIDGQDLAERMFNPAPADFGKLIADETEKWGKVIRAANRLRHQPAAHSRDGRPRTNAAVLMQRAICSLVRPSCSPKLFTTGIERYFL